MKYYLAILILICFPVQAEYYIGVGIGKSEVLFSDEQEWNDNGEIGTSFKIGTRHHIGGNFYGDLGYIHFSQALSNDEYESSSDHLFYWVEYRFSYKPRSPRQRLKYQQNH